MTKKNVLSKWLSNIKEKSDELEIMKAEVESLKEKVKREQIEYEENRKLFFENLQYFGIRKIKK